MAKIVADMSMSLDGFIAKPDDNVDRIHQWLYGLASWRERHGLEGGTEDRNADILDEAFNNVGAIVMGRRMFDLAEQAWGDNPPFHVPVFVVTHRQHDPAVKEGNTTFIFVTNGIEDAVAQAKAAAGDKDILLAGGAAIIQQFIKAGLLDEIQLHLVPVLLGSGIALFDHKGTEQTELECVRIVDSTGVTHLRFHILK